MKQLLITLITLGVLTITFNTPAFAADTINGAKIFSVECAGCHVNGGNIIRRGKNLKLKALKRNHLDSLQEIASLVSNGKNIMSAYKDKLSEQQIQDVSAYVLEQAAKDWR
ncbi:MAG: c-type cytochrome [Coleofasciculaceae cyanobacterium]